MLNTPQRPVLQHLYDRMIALWPEHRPYLERSMSARDADVLDFSEELAGLIVRLAEGIPGGIETLLSDYRYLCEVITLPEELNFRRTGKYRLTSFADAVRDVYSRSEFMNRYMNGLLVSNLLWNNHTHAMQWFVRHVVDNLAPGADHLEIGPGHGLYLYWAAQRPGIGRVEAWDVSEQSIANTRHALQQLDVTRPVTLTKRDLFATGIDDGGQYDSIVMSEILEHLEDPVGALRAASKVLRPNGTIWVHVPANSPAPDHIFLVNSPEHACDLVREAGLDVVEHAAFAMLGTTLEKARKQKLAISCLVLGRKAA